MQISEVSIDKIKPYANNPRKNDEAVDKVVRSIKDYGFQQPIVVDKDGVIIVGHTRLKAAQKLKMDTVPVVYADLPEDKANEYRLVDNKTNEFAEWDFDLLDIELDSLPEFDAEFYDFNINIGGWNRMRSSKMKHRHHQKNPSPLRVICISLEIIGSFVEIAQM